MPFGGNPFTGPRVVILASSRKRARTFASAPLFRGRWSDGACGGADFPTWNHVGGGHEGFGPLLWNRKSVSGSSESIISIPSPFAELRPVSNVWPGTTSVGDAAVGDGEGFSKYAVFETLLWDFRIIIVLALSMSAGVSGRIARGWCRAICPDTSTAVGGVIIR